MKVKIVRPADTARLFYMHRAVIAVQDISCSSLRESQEIRLRCAGKLWSSLMGSEMEYK
jgi:hypothetical protein